ncbi:Ig-like domain-containing protein [bacterium]|nr:Ig-like domain-containing protein [bacterium]
MEIFSSYTIAVHSGNSQSSTVATATGSPLVAIVKDGTGAAVSGVTVNWAVAGGGGSLSSASSATNGSGQSSTIPTLGTVAGSNLITATINGTSTSVSFLATGTPGIASVITVSAGNSQSAVAGAVAGNPFEALVTDSHSNPVSGATVNWAVTAGGGSLSSASNGTNGSGISASTLTLGTLVGTNTVSATINGTATSVSFLATGTAGSPATISVSSGNSQSATVGTALSSAFVAVVRDSNNNAVSGVTVNWAVTAGGGSLSSASNSTNASGQSSSTLTLGTTAGSNTVTATINGTATSTSFSATGTAGTPASIAVVSGNSQSGTAGSALSSAFVAVVRDSNSNAVSGVTVNWAVTAGGGSLSSASNSTNGSGQSSSTLTLGTTAGSNTVTATINGTATSTSFSATGTAGAPASISKSSGDSQTGVVSAALTNPFVVVVRDSNNNVLSGVTVDWAVTAGGGSLSSSSNSTDVAGQSTSTLTLGSSAGSNTVSATVNGTAITTSFSATAVVAFTLANDTGMVQKDAGATTLSVLSNDSSNLSLSFTVTSVTQPANGTVTNGTTNVSYQPNSGYTGKETFTYTVTDSQGHTGTATVTMKVMGTHTWTGASSNTWTNSTAANWCGTVNTPGLSGTCAGASAVPGASDTAIIDDTCSSANCTPTVNYAASVAGLKIGGSQLSQGGSALTIGSTGFTQTAGTFVGNATNITVNGPFSGTGGSFTSTSATLTLKGLNITFGSSFTFTHNSGTVRYNYDSGAVSITVANQSFNNVSINPDYGSTFNLNSSTMSVANNLTLGVAACGGSTGSINSGTIEVGGDISDWGGCGPSGSANVKMIGTGSKQVTFSNNGRIPNLEIAKTGGAGVTLSGTVNIAGSFKRSSGTLSPGTSTVVMQAWQSSSVMDLGVADLNNLSFDINSGINLSGSNITVLGNLLSRFPCGSGNLNIDNGTVNVKGNITLAGSAYCAMVGSVNVVINGTGAQTLSGTIAGSSNYSIPNVTIDKPSGTLTLAGTIYFYNNLTYLQGTVDTGTSTVRLVTTFGTGYFQSPGVSFYNLEIMPVFGMTMNLSGTTFTASNNLILDTSWGCSGATLTNGTVETSGNLAIGTYSSCGINSGNANVAFVGTGANATFTKNGNLPGSGTLSINKAGRIVSIVANTSTGRPVTVTAGTLSMAGFNLTIPTSLTLGSGTNVTRGGSGVLTVNGSTIPDGAYSGGTIDP